MIGICLEGARPMGPGRSIVVRAGFTETIEVFDFRVVGCGALRSFELIASIIDLVFTQGLKRFSNLP